MVYKPTGVCSQAIDIELDGDIIESVSFVGGCHGNLQGIAALVKGMKAQEVINCEELNAVLKPLPVPTS